MSLFDWISVLSLVLALFSTFLAIYFWKNPIDTNKKTSRILEDQDNNLTYLISRDHKGWLVSKIIGGDIDGTAFKHVADKRNNPNVNIDKHTKLKVLAGLAYRENE